VRRYCKIYIYKYPNWNFDILSRKRCRNKALWN